MSITVQVQYAIARIGIPLQVDFQRWVEAVLVNQSKEGEVTIRVVDEAEVAKLNWRYRCKQGATNVLSFPFEVPAPLPFKISLLGDLVICAPVVAREAREQAKEEKAHWAHLVVHGVLHLLGFDHQQEKEAQQMEAMEIIILRSLGYPNPYESA
ncbi:rRNA maturation RNase YbeY [Nitrosococcus wardiae]|uniref:Endoribonuclease YbeY n=1 Tax=Nitrosococcus wardiae TaxID=1814290 RepID=A0A4P7BV45_9GAMM|nr:rRNA maturation RNase YbeY [Nitrosococcus wardiae]QBQ53863.1 rRNA maturation RNase YbeY [Nitrosococcus wardiae]